MTTHGNTLFIFDGKCHISESASDGYFPFYGQMLLDSIHAFVNYFDEAKFQSAVRDSTQLSVDFDTYEFNDLAAIQKIVDAGIREPRIIPRTKEYQVNMWEIAAGSDTDTYISALLSIGYGHNFIAQFMSGVFFRFYDEDQLTSADLTFEALNRSRKFDNIVNMDERKVYFNDYSEVALIEVEFTDIIRGGLLLEELSTRE